MFFSKQVSIVEASVEDKLILLDLVKVEQHSVQPSEELKQELLDDSQQSTVTGSLEELEEQDFLHLFAQHPTAEEESLLHALGTALEEEEQHFEEEVQALQSLEEEELQLLHPQT